MEATYFDYIRILEAQRVYT